MARSLIKPSIRDTILPIAFFAICIGTIASLWLERRQDERDRLAIETVIMADQIRLRLESWIDDRVAIVQHLAVEMATGDLESEKEFRQEALHFLELYHGFLAINYVTAEGEIAIVVPEAPNRAAKKRLLLEHPAADVRASFTRARDTRKLTRTAAIQLLQGFQGLAIYVPVLVAPDLEPTGFINSVFCIDRLVDSCLSEASLRERFIIEMAETDGTVAYNSDPDFERTIRSHSVDFPVRIVDRPWTLHLELHPKIYTAAMSSTVDVLAWGGFLMSAVLALLLHLFMRRHAELAASKADYKLIIENQKELIVKLDAKLRVVFLSPSYSTIFARPPERAMGQAIVDLIPARDRDEAISAISSAIASGETMYNEQWITTPEGARLLSWSVNAVFAQDGSTEAVVIVGRDITAKRSLEEQLIQSQKMQAVGQLAGGIAHDFNNILQSITGCLELAMLDTDIKSQPYQDMEQARHSASRAAALTRQLLAFSRRQVLKTQNIDLNAIVQDMHELLQRSVGNGVDIKLDLADENTVIFADETQVQQILLNLCVNARDAISDRGRVSIRIGSSTLGQTFCRDKPWAKPGHYIMLQVSDDGCGMDASTLNNIFEPFYTTKKTSGGTGLGLSTVYGIVTQHNGLIDVESEPGRGTTFRIYFERSGNKTGVAPVSPLKAALGGQETILLAEDDDSVRNFTVRTLESAGYRVLPTVDGDDALAIFARHADEIDMLLLDVVMPNMGGREVHDRVRALRPDIPILFCSGFDSETIHSRFVLDKGLELLSKPFDRNQLLHHVRRLLDAAVAPV